MRSEPERSRRGDHYPLRFGTAASLLISGTLVLVLYVLPERYVISAGFRESGLSFPAPVTPFLPLPEVAVRAEPLPEAPPTRGAEASSAAEGGATTAEGSVPEPAPPSEDARLLLARRMRDLGRTADAERAYADLAAERPDHVALLLEWALAHAWAGEHARATDLLLDALRWAPDSAPVRIELARAYFSLGRVLDADAALAEVDDATLAAEGALGLRAALVAATTPSAPPLAETAPEPAPTLVALAARAREEGDAPRARRLLADALAARPDDAEAWQALADLLEYELADFEGARSALLEVVRLQGVQPEMELRLARLEIWTERSGDAAARLEALLATLDPSVGSNAPGDGSVGATGESAAAAMRALRAEAFALLGDLHRWAGDRLRASSHYVLALAEEPAQPRALQGLAALDAEISRQIAEVEAPWRGARASTLADTDDFVRTEAALAWVEIEPGGWVWGGAVGRRWLQGLEAPGLGGDRNGMFAELMGARWWRSGTLRTEFSFGGEHVRSAWDLSLGATLAHRTAGSTTEVRVEHAPSHPLTNTLQSVSAEVEHERLSVEHARRLGERTSLTAVGDAARLRANESPGGGAAMPDGATTRLQMSLAVTHSVGESLALGASVSALGFLDPAPLVSPGSAGAPSLRLFWDPRLAVSVGPLLRLDHELAPEWRVTGRLAPGLAVVDERGAPSLELVPHVGAEGGITHEAQRVRASLELFFYQGQFDGYRSYGARLTLGTLALPTLGGP